MEITDSVVPFRTIESRREGRENVLTVEIDRRLLATGGGHIVERGDNTYDRADEYSDLLLSILHELFDHSMDVQSVKIMLVSHEQARLFIHYTGPQNTDEMLARITTAAESLTMLVER